MAYKFIRQIHDLVDIAVDKGLTNIILRSQIDDAVHEAQMAIYRELVKDYVTTKNPVARKFLLPFEKKASITITAGIGSMPSDFDHELELWATVSSADRPVYIKEAGEFKKAMWRHKFRENDPIADAYTNIFGRIYTDTTKKIEIYPTTTPIVIIYLIAPTRPIYFTSYSATKFQHTYVDASATDVSWAETMWDALKLKTFEVLGMTTQNFQVVRQAQQIQPKEVVAP